MTLIPSPSQAACYLRGWFRTVGHVLCTGDVYVSISGHNFKTVDDPTPENIHVIKCLECGECSIGWSWDSLEADK